MDLYLVAHGRSHTIVSYLTQVPAQAAQVPVPTLATQCAAAQVLIIPTQAAQRADALVAEVAVGAAQSAQAVATHLLLLAAHAGFVNGDGQPQQRQHLAFSIGFGFNLAKMATEEMERFRAPSAKVGSEEYICKCSLTLFVPRWTDPEETFNSQVSSYNICCSMGRDRTKRCA